MPRKDLDQALRYPVCHSDVGTVGHAGRYEVKV